MEQQRSRKVWPLWLGSLIAVSAMSAYLANPQAAKTRVRGVKAAYKAAVTPAAAPAPAEDLRDSVAALAVGAPAARLLTRPAPARFPKPKRIRTRRTVPKKRAPTRTQARPAAPETEEEFLRIYQVVAPRALEKGKTFLVEGTVFDLDSAAYINKAALYFHDAKTKEAFLVSTNDWGEYSIRLPRNIDGYRLSIFKEKYRPQYLRDWTPSMKDANADIRRQVAAELLALRFEGMMVFHRPREDQVLDFALIAR